MVTLSPPPDNGSPAISYWNSARFGVLISHACRFGSIYSHGFIRAAVCVPSLRVGESGFQPLIVRSPCGARPRRIMSLSPFFPELGISAYSNGICSIRCIARGSKDALARLTKGKREADSRS